MSKESYWYKEWKKAAEKSTFSKIYPKAELCWDHAAPTYDLGMGNSLERVEAVMDELKKLGLDGGQLKQVLDVGSGTGNYAIPFSEIAEKVTALDCSEVMNRCLKEKLEETGIHNISVLTADFMEYSFQETYDLVFASMNPGTYCPEAFEKMLNLTEKVLIYVGILPSEAAAQRSRCTLEETLFDMRLTHGGSNNVIYPYELLKAKGFQPWIREVSCTWKYYEEKECALKRKKALYAELPIQNENWERELEEYIEEQAEGGRIMEEGECRLGILICDCRK